MKIIKNFISLLKFMRKGTIHFSWFKIVSDIMNFSVQVQQHGKPMLTKICVVDMSKDKIIGDFDMVSIWAGVGDANPIDRISHLRAQNNALKELLTKCKGSLEIVSNADLIMNINLVLKNFE